jgi:hypothetical protein
LRGVFAVVVDASGILHCVGYFVEVAHWHLGGFCGAAVEALVDRCCRPGAIDQGEPGVAAFPGAAVVQNSGGVVTIAVIAKEGVVTP